MVEFEKFLFSIKLPSDYYDVVVNSTTPGIPVGEEFGLADVCELYNITSEETEDLIDDIKCDKNIPYDCPAQISEKCFHTPSPLDFVYERFNDTYNISRYDDDAELVDKIQTGKGDEEYIYDAYYYINVDFPFSATYPETVDVDRFTGENDLQ